MKLFKQAILILIGLIFIVSAVFKLFSVDSFENYIYSFGLFGFGLCNVAARLLIAFEAFLGLCLVFRLFRRQSCCLAVLTLAGFSAFLLVQVLSGETENCHCFGEAIELSPLASLAKNIAMIALLAFAFPPRTQNLRWHKWLALTFAVAALAGTLIVSPPNLLFKIETSTKDVNRELLQKIKSENSIGKDKRVLCFLGTSCKYCRLSANRLSAFLKNGDLQKSDIQFIFMNTNTAEEVKAFTLKTATEGIDCCIIPPADFLIFTGGKMPVILLQQGDSLVGKLGYRNLTEKNLQYGIK